MSVPMKTSSKSQQRSRSVSHAGVHLVSVLNDLADLCHERLGTVCWNIPRCFDIVLVKELEKSIDTDSGTKDPTRDIHWISLRSIFCVDPIVTLSEMLI